MFNSHPSKHFLSGLPKFSRNAWLRAALLLAFTVPAFASEKVRREEFDFEGKTRTYFFMAPEEKDPLPLVILLHGSGRNGEIMTSEWKGIATKEHFMIVAPNAIKADWAMATEGPNFFNALVQQVTTMHEVDMGRIYLFGHSGGANYALIMALLESEYFAAAAIHAGAMHKEDAHVFGLAKRKIPIGIWVGDSDAYYPLDLIEDTRRMFEEKGFKIRVDVIPHHTHDYYSDSYRVNQNVWEFLKQSALKEQHFQEFAESQ
ncbi:MAG: poly(3-hydroxybutyrate) depolymerase [Candidatus Angelobacter sp.]|nr:poly(3-hydroxybutyrate) depolymerase [Candidatus Angelobacter sp.]